MLKVDPGRPVDPLTVRVLSLVRATAERRRIPHFVSGAMARDILVEHVHGVHVPQATRDIDLAVSLPGWDAFAALKGELVATGRFVPDPRNQGKLWLTGSDGKPGYPVDLIPFGGVTTAAGEIAWPPGDGEVMKVIGYEEALSGACTVAITPDLHMPFVSLPMLAILKIVAWSERRANTKKDAGDLVLLLDEYENLGNTPRLYGEAIELLKEVDFDLDLAGPRLLGLDASAQAKVATVDAVVEILAAARHRDPLITAMAAAIRARGEPVETAAALLDQFEAGLSQTRP